MSAVDSLPNAIKNLANEKNGSLVQSHVRNVIAGVQELLKKLESLEKRIVALEEEQTLRKDKYRE
ncbi:hypothetical protein [Methylocapsa aurea]|uniref:hypothetical protein n=1 Tax=Methylocapsa aurea TaxID=663610 RepID=UPI000569E5C4|nr:hypothetical protein [Methylocapsa aurea]